VKLKQYNIDIERYYGTGLYDGEEYADLRVREVPHDGEWVKSKDYKKYCDKLQKKTNRMQKRIDKLEGRA
jgi:hypothetical protein